MEIQLKLKTYNSFPWEFITDLTLKRVYKVRRMSKIFLNILDDICVGTYLIESHHWKFYVCLYQLLTSYKISSKCAFDADNY